KALDVALRRLSASCYATHLRSRDAPGFPDGTSTMTAVFDFVHHPSIWRLLKSRAWLPALFLISAAACSGNDPGAGAAGGGAAGGGRAGGAPAMPVEMVTLTPKPVEQTGDFVGTVKSRRTNTIQPQVEGIITAIPAKSGD